MVSTNNIAVSIQHLNFSYSGQYSKCITDINLAIHPGERFGLFGPNGAGKTTLIHCITGVLPVKEGSIHILGNNISLHSRKVKSIIGFVPQDFSFYNELSPVQNLEFFGAWHGLSKAEIKNKIAELLEVLDLTEVRNKQVQKFSGGMKRRVNLAIGVINNPKILILDEPTVGVDIQSRHSIMNYLKQLNSTGTTLIYTSHQLNEAEELCNKIALIDHGKIIVHDSLQNLFTQHGEDGLESLYLKLTGKKFKDV